MAGNHKPAKFYKDLEKYISGLPAEFEQISEGRKSELQELAGYIAQQQKAGAVSKLTFICTHNSRRSQLAQTWAMAAAAYYGVENVSSFSGGTESTAFNPWAVAALKRAGFKFQDPGGKNPRYEVYFGKNAPKLICYSKKYDDPINPKKNFAAVMVCSDADKNCPIVPGAEYRIPIPYADPKVSDGTGKEEATYDERCRQIAREMFYVFSCVKT